MARIAIGHVQLLAPTRAIGLEPAHRARLATPVARGRGLASEAARAVRQMARENLRGLRLISLIAQGNEASVRVAEAAGARLEREIEWRDTRALVYRHPD